MQEYEVQRRIRNYFTEPQDVPETPSYTIKSYLSLLSSLKISADSIKMQRRIKKYCELQKSLSNCHDLLRIPELILQQSSFNNFQSCQILIHKKGGQVVKSLFFHQNHLQDSSLPVAIFNKISLTIKKSKNKRFDQGNLDLHGLEILGPFLAQVLDSEKYNSIIVISHNGFLPPSHEEEDDFYHFINKLSPFLSDLIYQNEIKDRNSIANQIINNIPFAFQVNKDEKIIHNSGKREPYDTHYDLSNNHEYRTEKLNLKSSSQHYHTERVHLLGELLNTLKHELMNPLFGLNLGIQMLEAPENEEDTKLFLDEMLLSVSRSQNILNNFSTLYNDTNHSEHINIEQLISEVITLTKSETKHIKKNITISEEIIVKINKTSLSQIIFNMIVNAAQSIKHKYPNDSYGLINIDIYREKNECIICISDNGTGIKEDILKKIFTPFFTTKEHGTGLGLTICQSLINKSNGAITIVNNKNGGATFEIRLKDCK